MPPTLPRCAAALALVAGVALVVPAAAPPPAPPPKPDAVTIGGQPLFAMWPKDKQPDAVLVVSGQTHGYLQPCGCSRPQTGGLERRAVFIEYLKAKGWPVAAVEVGDVFPDGAKLGAQARLKYVATMASMREMGYLAVGIGKSEIKSDLFNTLASYGLQKEQRPFTLAANAVGVIQGKPVPREKHFDSQQKGMRPLVEALEVATVGKVPVGVGGVVGKALQKSNEKEKWDTGLDFPEAQQSVQGILKALAAHPSKPELKVLLFQGPSTDAEAVAKFDPGFDVIVSSTDETNPPMVPAKVGNALVVHTGTRGQYVGVVGAFKKPGGGFELHYQLVPMTESFLTPGSDADAYKANKVLPILQEYAQQVKTAKLLKEWPKVDHPAQLAGAAMKPAVKLEFVGSEACKKCHEAEYAVWDKTPHGHALDALEKYAARPTLRNFDPECVRCHTVGFDNKTGYVDAETTPLLKHVGCESCHGPGSGHVANGRDKDLQKLLRPWAQREAGVFDLPDEKFFDKMAKLDVIERGKVPIPPAQQILINQVSGVCAKCHDADNDPNFDLYKYWPKIVHGKKRAPAEPPKGK
jgi:Cytochrome c554 and c-prime